ncbi:MAG: MAPEG family protein [Deltaproteobacteria bacterium]|nr:MAPEG family protein [Deltaproteobacteria bacterium]
MALSTDQRVVLAGMAGAAGTALAVVWASGALGIPAPPEAPTAGDRLAFALRCDLFAALALFAGIAAVARYRFFENEIDGTLAPRAHRLDVHRAYIQNTLEQLALLLVAHLAFAASQPAERLRLLPVLVGLFLLGRAAFWLGYLHSAPARAFGFALTFYPTAVLLVYDALRIGSR